MKRSLTGWQLSGFVFTGTVGTILHFIYDWTDQNIIVAPFSAVNESIWEHMKLLFFPMFVYALIEYFIIGNDYENFWCAKLIGTLTGLLLIPMIYYTYTGAFGVSSDLFNIIIFFLSAGAAYIGETQLLKSKASFCGSSSVPLIILYLIALAFCVFTFLPPKIPLFQDPTTNLYGIQI